MDMLAKPLKKFMRTDIKKLIDVEEYQFAAEILNSIMDKLSDEIYLDDRSFDNVIYYYQDYADILLNENVSAKEKEKIRSTLNYFAFFGF